MKVLAFAASNSKESINQKLVKYAASQFTNAEVTLLDLNDFEMPIFSLDRQAQDGIHDLALKFKQHINDADLILISFAEYNGSYSSAFKNIFDWISRIDKKIWSEKDMILLATSPGPRGGKSVLQTAVNSFPHQGGNVKGSFSLPSFNKNFNDETGITNDELKNQLLELINS